MALSDQAVSIGKHAGLVAVLVGIVIFVTSFQRVAIPREDKVMRSIIGEGERFTIYPNVRRPSQLVSGDIVAFAPSNPAPGMGVRLAWVIAVEGSRVEIRSTLRRDGGVWVNGSHIGPPSKLTPGVSLPEFVVPKDTVYLLFDDATAGGDSLTTGPVPWRRILGKAKVKPIR